MKNETNTIEQQLLAGSKPSDIPDGNKQADPLTELRAENEKLKMTSFFCSTRSAATRSIALKKLRDWGRTTAFPAGIVKISGTDTTRARKR